MCPAAAAVAAIAEQEAATAKVEAAETAVPTTEAAVTGETAGEGRGTRRRKLQDLARLSRTDSNVQGAAVAVEVAEKMLLLLQQTPPLEFEPIHSFVS